MTGIDWLAEAKSRDGMAGDVRGDGAVIAAALIAIAEELRRANDRPGVAINVSGDALPIPDAVLNARLIQQTIEDRIADLS